MKPESKGSILLVDDDEALGESLRDVLTASGYTVTYEKEADCALDLIEEKSFDTVVTDFEMPLIDGMELITRARRFRPQIPIIMMTAFSSTERAIETTRRGAFDYLVKPVEIPDLLEVVEKAVASGRLTARKISLGDDEEAGESEDPIIGTTPAMMKIFKEIGKVAPKNIPVLITGETGTGKELIARAIFQNSDRNEHPFIAVNCVSIPSGPIDSELFGHERGAFAHAVAQRIGRFEQADGGTIFLDEIGDLPYETQGRLLRVLEEGIIQRVGGRKDLEIDVRIISATHHDLTAMVSAGKFREDLYYRINAVSVAIPPLRDRREDIPELCRYFLRQAALDFEMPEPSISPKALNLLENEFWPGNVRQLRNTVRKLLLESGGRTIGPDLVRAASGDEPSAPDLADSRPDKGGFDDDIHQVLLSASKDELDGRGAYDVLVEKMEHSLYKQAVAMSHGNQSKIAKWLGVSRLTVRDKLDKFDLFPKRETKSKKAKKKEG